MRDYEVLYILRPDMSEEEYTAAVEKFNALIQANGGEVVKTDIWGKRKLAYEIEKLREGYYVLVTFKAEPELPQELETELENLGIHVVYGMEWLGKNGYSEAQNLELVRAHPFLPYALILSEAEVRKLSRNMGGIYTSFPIPIVAREMLEQNIANRESGIIRLEGVSFYVWFNENLLNEEKLRNLVQEKERQIEKKRESIAIRQAE